MDAWGHIIYPVYPVVLSGIYRPPMVLLPMSLTFKLCGEILHILVEEEPGSLLGLILESGRM